MRPDPRIEPLVSPHVDGQWPAHYRENHPLLVGFLRRYYEWMESTGQAIYHSRRLLDYRDVDRTPEDQLVHFLTKYLSGLTLDSRADVRRLVKSALDVYRTKGTERSVDLLFRLVFGDRASVYYPSRDIFRLSDAEWVNPRFIDVLVPDRAASLVGFQIEGAISGATAFAERLVRRIPNGKIVDSLFVSSVVGEFVIGERLSPSLGWDVPPSAQPVVAGSLGELEVLSSIGSWSVGEIVNLRGRHGVGGLARVSSVRQRTGEAVVSLIDGGAGYSLDAEILVSDQMLLITGIDPTYQPEYFYYDQQVSQEVATIEYESSTGHWAVGDRIWVYDSGDPVGMGVVFGVEQTGPDSGVVAVYTHFGDLSDGTYYSDSNTFSAELSVGGFDSEVATGRVLDMVQLEVLVTESSGSVSPGAVIRQGDWHSSIVKFTKESSIVLEKVRGRVVPGVPLVTSSASLTPSGEVIATLGVVSEVGTFATGQHAALVANGEVMIASLAGQGSGLELEVQAIVPSEEILLPTDYLEPFLDVELDDLFPFSADPSSDLDTVIDDSLTYEEFSLGEIATLRPLNPGAGYDVPPSVRAIEPIVAGYQKKWWRAQIVSQTSDFLIGEVLTQASTGASGRVAYVEAGHVYLKRLTLMSDVEPYGGTLTGDQSGSVIQVGAVYDVDPGAILYTLHGLDADFSVESGTSVYPETLEVIDSGVGFEDAEALSFERDEASVVAVRAISAAVGVHRGRYDTTGGHLSSSKKLFDGHYYQEFSYEIRTSVTPERYDEIHRRLIHPVGTKAFSRFSTSRRSPMEPSASGRVSQSLINPNEDSLDFNNPDNSQYVPLIF